LHSTALRELYLGRTANSFEDALSRLQSGTKGCDKDKHGCGAPAPVMHVLDRPPSVYTISLAWEAAQAAQEDVAATLKARCVGVAVFALRCFVHLRVSAVVLRWRALHLR
jgi:hypothetical protein